MFDAPGVQRVGLPKRMVAARQALQQLHGGDGPHDERRFGPVELVEHTIARGKSHVLEELTRVERLGGEGLVS